MKIGIVLPYSIVKGGGVKELVLAQQAELKRRGHEAYIITPRPQKHIDEPEDHVIFVGGSTDFHAPTSTTVQISASVSESIERMLEEKQFDILHFHEPWVPMLSAQMLPRSKAINVATFHASLPENVVGRTLARVVTPYTKPLLKYIDAFTAVSDTAAAYLCTLTDAPVAIIPCSVDQQQFVPPKDHDDARKRKTIFYVGRLEGRKGVKYLLHAFRLLQDRHPDVSLIIGGDGPDRAKLELLAEDLELENVSFLGFISTKDKVKHLQDADLACFPAIYGESFGIVLLEAMGTGTVTVAGDNAGYTGVMRDFGAISLVTPKESVDFARRLELLLYQPELRKLWRTWAANELPHYTNEAVVSQYLEVYKKALAER